MVVVLLSGDLMVVSRGQGAAARCGITLRSAANALDAIDACRATDVTLLVIDLGIPAIDMQHLVRDVKSLSDPPPRVVAFGPHVHEERLAAARAAGCDEVMSRGQFFARIDVVIAGH